MGLTQVSSDAEFTATRRLYAGGPSGDPLVRDLVYYFACLAFAVGSALASEFYGYRVWGNFASIGYGLALAHTVLLLFEHRSGTDETRHAPWWHSRWTGIGAIG